MWSSIVLQPGCLGQNELLDAVGRQVIAALPSLMGQRGV